MTVYPVTGCLRRGRRSSRFTYLKRSGYFGCQSVCRGYRSVLAYLAGCSGELMNGPAAAIGPLLVGPLSEVYGRSIIYRVSYTFFFLCSWPVAFAPHTGEFKGTFCSVTSHTDRIFPFKSRGDSIIHLAVYLIFRFLTGFFSSAFLSVAGGTVSDIYIPAKTAV